MNVVTPSPEARGETFVIGHVVHCSPKAAGYFRADVNHRQLTAIGNTKALWDTWCGVGWGVLPVLVQNGQLQADSGSQLRLNVLLHGQSV